MRREVVFPVVLIAVLVVAGQCFAAAPASPGVVAPPGGILVDVNSGHCYTPDAVIRITATNLTPGSSVQASSQDAVSVLAKTPADGGATLKLLAPSGLAKGRRIEALLIGIGGTDATGQRATEETAIILAKHQVCSAIMRDH